MDQALAAGRLATFRGHRYINLTTFRRNGAAVVTPVWFAVEGGKVYVGTPADSGKVKRIGRTPRVRIEPCSATGRPLGPSLDAVARVLPSGEAAAANRALDFKYGWRRRMFAVLHRLRHRERALLEVVPA